MMRFHQVRTAQEAQALADSIDGIWATITPGPLQFEEAVRAFRKLYRFAGHGAYKWPIVHNNKGYSWEFDVFDVDDLHRKEFRINTIQGWPDFITSVAEFIGATADNDIEFQIVKEVMNRGWLDGRLQDRLIPPEERKVAARRKKLSSLRTRITSWERKQKRAANALRKLRNQLKRMEKS